MKTFCVISHTHWDREWYEPLEIFKLKLVDLIDRCLVTLKNYPDFIFHLDAQTIVLEDYLSIRTSNRDILKQYISQGRLVVGPWYLQNDFYLTSGEATIRNLLEGTRLAHEYGDCGMVGYAPDQFGNISQLPQILDGFSIDNFVFGRGYRETALDETGKQYNIKTKSEFIWEGADKTKALAVHMPYWYNNAQRFSENIETSKLLIDVVERLFEDVAMTPYLLLMNGVDHLEAQDNLLPILEKLNSDAKDKKVLQYRMDNYIKDVKAYIEDNNIKLPVKSGELRGGGDYEVLKGTLSSRSYLKKENVLLQNKLENELEPLYAIAELAGMNGVYSLDHFRYMWKELMKNHPHDSICGCSRDEVHMHMEDNFKRINETAREIMQRGMVNVAQHMGTNGFSDENYILIVANTTEQKRSEVIKATVDIILKEDFESFEIFDDSGKSVEFEVISKEKKNKDVFSPINLPGSLEVMRYEIYLYATDVNPFSIKGYIIKKSDKAVTIVKDNLTVENNVTIENDKLVVSVTKCGKVNVTNKDNGRIIQNAIDIEDTADVGDSYVYVSTTDPAIWGSSFSANVTVLENNEYTKTVKIERVLKLPAFYDFKETKRSDELVESKIDIMLTIKKGSDTVEVAYKLDNTAKDHRVRLVLNTGINALESIADIPFDIVKHGEEAHPQGTWSKVLPNTSFALLQDDNGGVCVFTEGTHEYEHCAVQNCGLAFTIVRSTGVINVSDTNGEQWDAPENQCIREITGRIGVTAYAGCYISANIALRSKQFRTPLLSCVTACDSKKFAGGRTAVQDTKLEELFFLPDPYKGVKIKDNSPYVTVQSGSTVVTALKKAEDGSGIILRLLNVSDENDTMSINANDKTMQICKLNETVIGEYDNDITVTGKKLVTIKLS